MTMIDLRIKKSAYAGAADTDLRGRKRAEVVAFRT